MRPCTREWIKTLPVRWATRTELYEWLIADGVLQPGGTGVEIGVCRGANAVDLKRILVPDRLFLVDDWQAFPTLWGNEPAPFEQRKQDARHGAVKTALEDEHTRVVRMSSLRAAYAFPLHSLDFVYIDADHHFAPALCDIITYFDRLKNGGILMCHDFTPTVSRGGVADAVYELCSGRLPPTVLGVTGEGTPTVVLVKGANKMVVKAGHLGGNALGSGDRHSVETGVWAWMKERYKLETVLDLGCGIGNAMPHFSALGYWPIGLDGLRENCDLVKTFPTICHDLTTGPIYLSNIDLVWSCEVAEHIDKKFVDNFLDTLCMGRFVGMTHGLPGQAGYHHVNLQPPEYWQERIEKRGFVMIPRKLFEDRIKNKYFQRSGMLFRRAVK